jgi:protein-S-isoprenylcysteine O-methyltransferase Ste14
LSGTLIALAAIPISALLWGLFTGRWTAESRRARLEIWPAIVLPLLMAYINFVVIPVEEQSLRGVFGDAYQEYGARVGRWL